MDDSNCGTIDCSLYYVQNGTESAITIETCYSKKDITSNRCEGIEDCKDPNTADCSIQSNDVPKYTCGDCKYISSTSCTETTLGSCSNYADGTDCGSGKICQSGSCVTPVNCVGGWSDTSICSETCGDGVLQQVYSISVDEAYGGATCPYVDGDTRWGTSTCNLGSCCDVDMGNSCSIDQCTSGTVDCEGVCAFSSYLALGTDCTGICKSCSGGSCIFTDSNHDYQNECSSGGVCQNTDLLYTYTGNCDGAGACAYSSSSCSVCNYCSGSSCINVPSGSDTNNDCSSYSACTSSTVLRIYTGYCDGVGGCAYTISSAPTCKVCSGISFVNAPDGTACGTGKICDVGSCCTLSCPAADSVCSGTTYTGSDGCGGTCNVVGSKTDGECSSFYLISDHYYGQDIIVDESTKDLYVAGDKPGEGIYVVKYDSSGNLQWQKKIAGTYLGGASSIELDSSGNILIGGHLWQNSEYRRYAMIIKLSPSGSVIWSKTLKGSVDTNMYRDTYFFDIDIDSNNNIYGTGYTYSEGQGNTDLFIAKYDFLGNLKWQRVIGQLGTDRGDSIKVGNDGNIYVAGRSYIDSSYRIILLKYNSLGTLLWQKIILGSVASAHGSGLAIDSSNNIYVSDIHNKDYVLLAKYDSSGNLKWMKGLSDIGYSNIKGMDLANNNIFISIYTSSVGLGAAEYFISKFDLNGNILSQQSFGSANLETTRNLFANDESVYVIGHETSTGTYKNLLLKIPSNMDFTGEYGVYSLINQNLILSNLALTSSSSTLIGATSHLIPESSNQVSYTITKSYSKINLD
ncbi:hypothetical protein C0585_06060 [Candidatus Woesearchaeota archaeon]|nr:MAG: hypothetical protein C0585_06060 [Candidatus Woesearchaeota archaeon]